MKTCNKHDADNLVRDQKESDHDIDVLATWPKLLGGTHPTTRPVNPSLIPLVSFKCFLLLKRKNTNTVRISDNLGSRHRYQRRPSNLFIGRLRIELHSEHEYFSGQRFVECVSDRIRDEGNLGLGICAVPNGCDADSGKELGKGYI